MRNKYAELRYKNSTSENDGTWPGWICKKSVMKVRVLHARSC